MDYFRAWYQVNAAVIWLETLVGIVVLVGAVIWLWTRLRRLQDRYQRLMGDSTADGLEEMLEDHVRRVRGALDRVDALERLAHDLQRTLGYGVQWVGMVRFNPFRDTGGDQSFAIALADAHGDGIVLSSLHRPDITRVYAKPLLGWQSTHPLTDEELEAIETARRSRAPA
ncbi:MAG: DUF4446 family protein [Anaerolineae bacterium]|nr:MAG: DUF4446 family protein [Anaerolineae bacterium]